MQVGLASQADAAEPWTSPTAPLRAGGVFVAFPAGYTGRGAAGDAAVAGACVMRAGERVASAVVSGEAGAAYAPGLLALREGPVLERAVLALEARPDVLLVNATGRDHPRGAGVALHLGAVVELPTVGVTDRPLIGEVDGEPDAARGSRVPVRVGERVVAYVLRTRAGTRPVIVHAGWRTSPERAVDVVASVCGRFRTPAPLREARRLARTQRARG